MGEDSAMLGIVVVVVGIIFFVFTWPYWRMCKRVGFKPALSLLNLIPFVGNLILIYYLAFSKWKRPPEEASVESSSVGKAIHPE
jgi:hypothetical protein